MNNVYYAKPFKSVIYIVFKADNEFRFTESFLCIYVDKTKKRKKKNFCTWTQNNSNLVSLVLECTVELFLFINLS